MEKKKKTPSKSQSTKPSKQLNLKNADDQRILTQKAKRNPGRPTKYSQEFTDLICKRVASHTVGLGRLCKMYDDMPNKDTINEWRFEHSSFSVQYAQAKIQQADLLAEECLEIADNDSGDIAIDKDGREVCNTEFIARSRLRVDTRKWLASKLIPKVYGSMKELEEVKGENEKLKQELFETRSRLDEVNKKEY